jgi:tetratricopeptide (TPR) repeat protein
VPATLLVALAAARFVPQGEASADAGDLYDRASRAYAEARWADAAEYARHALFPARDMALHASLLSLRGESLLRAARPREALLSFQDVLGEPSSPYRAQALFGAAEAQSALGDEAGARESRARLLKEFPESPWATRVQATPAAATAVR